MVKINDSLSMCSFTYSYQVNVHIHIMVIRCLFSGHTNIYKYRAKVKLSLAFVGYVPANISQCAKK